MSLKGFSIKFISFIALVFLILGIFLTSIQWVAFNPKHYQREYKRLNIAEYSGMEFEDLLLATDVLLDYIKDKRTDIHFKAKINGSEREVFNQREIDHMVDVKDLFLKGFRWRWFFIAAFLIIALLAYFIRGREAIKDFSQAYLLALAFLIIVFSLLAMLIFIDFTAFWNKFHHIFFTNDLWMLDPAEDVMIRMFPEEFFLATVYKMLGFFVSQIVLIMFLALAGLGKFSKLRKR